MGDAKLFLGLMSRALPQSEHLDVDDFAALFDVEGERAQDDIAVADRGWSARRVRRRPPATTSPARARASSRRRSSIRSTRAADRARTSAPGRRAAKLRASPGRPRADQWPAREPMSGRQPRRCAFSCLPLTYVTH